MILVYCCSNWLADIVYLRSGVNSDAYPNQLKDYHIPFELKSLHFIQEKI